jgi:Domain of unknown function (DUF6438)
LKISFEATLLNFNLLHHRIMKLELKTTNHLFFVLFLLSLMATLAPYSSVQAQQKVGSEILITIERESCFGSCPVYSAQIYADGTVIYVGISDVKVKGERRHKISETKVKELIAAFERINYFLLKDKYQSDENGMSMTDLPTTTTSISIEGKQKKVVNYYCAPKELDELENFIDKVASLYEYIGPE